jgi:ribosomal protein S18 acetylase RimI-like enzyme
VFSAAFGFSIPAADLETYLKDAYSVSAIEEDIRSSSKHLIVACTSRPNTADSDVNSDSDSDSDWDWPTDSNSHSNSNSRSETYTEQVIGFAQLTEGTTEPCIEDLEGLVELQRLYVDADFHGLGVGKALTNKAEGLARDLAYRIMWLGVWEGNFRAQRVYESMSFSRAGEHEFKMGRCIQTDWIMIKDL